MHKTVAQLMSVDFVTVTARMSLEDALLLLVESDATELCVVDDNDHFQGIVSDFDLLKSRINNQLDGQCAGSLISRAVIVLSADSPIEQVVPMFRDGSCSRAYVCRDGRLLGRLSRSNVLRHLTQRETVAAHSVVRPVAMKLPIGNITTVNLREVSPRPPQFITTSNVSVLGSVFGR